VESATVNAVIANLAVVIIGSAILGAVSHFLRQPLLVAYIVCGILAGPHGLARLVTGEGEVESTVAAQAFLQSASDLGLLFLLFLVGLVLNLQRLRKIVGPATVVTLGAGAVLFGVGLGLGLAFTGSWTTALVLGIVAMFSSTILVVKLLPTRRLHDSPVGTVCIGVLILQDLLAILVMLAIRSFHEQALSPSHLGALVGQLAALVVAAVVIERWGLSWLLAKVERYPELLFIIGLGWCFALAEVANVCGVGRGIGAFIAGVSLARNPIALYISEKVVPLRDFFIVLFFFTLGAQFDLDVVVGVLLPAAAITLALMAVKPLAFFGLFRLTGEPPGLAGEAAVRLSQMSEFSLVIVWLAVPLAGLSGDGAAMIQVACLLTMVLSTYWVVLRYASPLAVNERLKQS